MKLRNKKTGDITSNVYMYDGTIFVYAEEDSKGEYTTLAELNEEWGDVEPAEPLIKDEKVRKAVRAWAEAVDVDSAFVEKWSFDGDQFVLSDNFAEIHFRIKTPNELKFYKRYTITELCGEEK